MSDYMDAPELPAWMWDWRTLMTTKINDHLIECQVKTAGYTRDECGSITDVLTVGRMLIDGMRIELDYLPDFSSGKSVYIPTETGFVFISR